MTIQDWGETQGIHLRPAESETERRMAVSCGVTGETSRERKPGGHFSETRHDDEDNGSDEGVTDEERARASIGERFTRSNNETSSESTTNSCSNRVSLRHSS